MPQANHTWMEIVIFNYFLHRTCKRLGHLQFDRQIGKIAPTIINENLDMLFYIFPHSLCHEMIVSIILKNFAKVGKLMEWIFRQTMVPMAQPFLHCCDMRICFYTEALVTPLP